MRRYTNVFFYPVIDICCLDRYYLVRNFWLEPWLLFTHRVLVYCFFLHPCLSGFRSQLRDIVLFSLLSIPNVFLHQIMIELETMETKAVLDIFL